MIELTIIGNLQLANDRTRNQKLLRDMFLFIANKKFYSNLNHISSHFHSLKVHAQNYLPRYLILNI